MENNKVESGYTAKWVKLSDRLPKDFKSPYHHFRYCGRKVNGNIFEYSDGVLQFEVKGHGIFGGYIIEQKDFDRIEFLDESTSPAPVSGYSLPPKLLDLLEGCMKGLKVLQNICSKVELSGGENTAKEMILDIQQYIDGSSASFPAPLEGEKVTDEKILVQIEDFVRDAMREKVPSTREISVGIKLILRANGIQSSTQSLPTDEQIEAMAKEEAGNNFGDLYRIAYATGAKAIRSLLAASPVKTESK